MILLSCSKLQYTYISKRGLLLQLFSYIDRLQDSGQSNNCGEDNYYFFNTRTWQSSYMFENPITNTAPLTIEDKKTDAFR